MRKSLVASYLIVGILSVAMAFVAAPWLDARVSGSALPASTLLSRIAGPAAGAVAGFATLASLAGLIVAEYAALDRLWKTMFPRLKKHGPLLIGAFFIAADVVSLVDPFGFYNATIVPSLAALFASQLMVFIVFPLFLRRRGRWKWACTSAVLIASLWALYGLYLALAPTPTY